MIAWRGRHLPRPYGNAWIFCVVFSITLLLDLAIREFLLPYVVPQLHIDQGFVIGGDSRGFHMEAVAAAAEIRASGWGTWQPRQLDSPVTIASALYAIFGSSPLVLLPFNAAVHALSAVLLVTIFTAASLDRRQAVIAAVPFVVFPTAAAWHSQLHRDGVFILGSYAWLAGLLHLLQPRGVSVRRLAGALALLMAGVALTRFTRGYSVVVVTAWLAAAVPVLAVLGVRWLRHGVVGPLDVARRVTSLVLVCLAAALIGGAGRTEVPAWALSRYGDGAAAAPSAARRPPSRFVPSSSAPATAEERRLMREECERWQYTPSLPPPVDRIALSLVVTRESAYGASYRTAGTTLDWDRCITSAAELAAYLPRAFQVGLWAPFPVHWVESSANSGQVIRVITGVEMAVVYITMAAVPLALGRFRHRPEVWLLMAVAVSMLVLYAVVVPNIGTQHRLRYAFLMLVVGLGASELSTRYRWARSKGGGGITSA